MNITITEEVASRVLATVDAGLCSGLGVREPGKMCVEAAVCLALGLPHGYDPGPLRSLKVQLNDSCWPSPQERAKGLRRLALAQLGSAGELDELEFADRVTKMALRKYISYSRDHPVFSHPEASVRTSFVVRAVSADAPYNDRYTVLSDFAEDVVQILIEMNAPGCQWLGLT
jgi:hypothetical protein